NATIALDRNLTLWQYTGDLRTPPPPNTAPQDFNVSRLWVKRLEETDELGAVFQSGAETSYLLRWLPLEEIALGLDFLLDTRGWYEIESIRALGRRNYIVFDTQFTFRRPTTEMEFAIDTHRIGLTEVRRRISALRAADRASVISTPAAEHQSDDSSLHATSNASSDG
ncbi:MAG: hypothetical protein OXG25_02335, partial [Gammaproteobacteria bacterium]|nr:hypothetical protein [Gammaproteobacteria bacterium]